LILDDSLRSFHLVGMRHVKLLRNGGLRGLVSNTLLRSMPVMSNVVRRFAAWWRAPVTKRDRILGAFVGGLGCFWIGGLGRVALGALPVSLSAVLEWGIAAAVVGIALGTCFPKAMTCVCFPFSTFGVG
jgi:hypothetical protein